MRVSAAACIHSLSNPAYVEDEVDANGIVGLDRNVLTNRDFETRQLRADVIAPRDKRGHQKIPLGVGHGRTSNRCRAVRDRDGDAGNHAPRCVADVSDHAGLKPLTKTQGR